MMEVTQAPPGLLASDAAMAMGRWTWRIGQDEVACSPELLSIYGMDGHAGPVGIERFAERIVPEDRSRVLAVVNRTVGTRRPGHTVYFRIRRPDGAERQIMGRVRLRLDAHGEPHTLTGVDVDLTDDALPIDSLAVARPEDGDACRCADALPRGTGDPLSVALRERDTLLGMLDAMPVLVTLYDPEARIAFVNRTFEEKTGWSQADMAGPQGLELCYPDPAYRAEIVAQMAACEGWHALSLRTRAGTDLATYWAGVRLSEDRCLGIGLELTVEKDLERALRTAETRLRLAQEVARIGTFDWDIVNDRNRWSPEIERLYGLSVGGFGETYAAWAERVHPDDLPGAEAAVQEAVETGRLAAEWRAQRPDGPSFWVEARGVVEKDAAGKPVRMYGVNLDISERKQLEAALRAEATAARERADEFEALSASAPLGIAMFDTDFRFVWCNDWLIRVNGAPATDVVGRSIEDVLGPQTSTVLREIQPRLLAGEAVGDREIDVDHPETGEALVFVVSYKPLFRPDGTVSRFLGVVRDVTERKRMEASRELALQEMSHRVKNIFAIVQSMAARTFADDPSPAAETFRGRLAALAGAHDVLLRTEHESVDLAALVDTVLSAFDEPERIACEGPALEIPGAASGMLALTLHELATNAVKYGALSSRSGAGRVSVRWGCEKDGERVRCSLVWRERGGPLVSPPAKRGFGTRMIETALARNLGARVEIRFPSEGAECTLSWLL